MSLLYKTLLLPIIAILFGIGFVCPTISTAQMNTEADSLRHFESLMESAERAEEFENARSWLNRYYRNQVTRSEEDVPDYELPALLTTDGGAVVTDAEMWMNQRRPEISSKFKTYVYGKVPEFDYEMSFQTLSVDRQALDGLATRKQISIQLDGENDGTEALSIELLIYLPNHRQDPAPAAVGLNFYGNQAIHSDKGIRISEKWMRPNEGIGIRNNRATEETRGTYSERWPVEMILERGYAVVTAYAGDIEPDAHNRFRQGVRALAYGEAGNPSGDEWGTLSAWAWGLSRVMDYLESDEQIDHQSVVLMGHSRLGKAALWAGAMDDRFAVVISNNSGCGGAALSRRQFGETIGVINTSFPHWFCDHHNQFNGREETLPVDQHMLLAMIAPRPLYVASAEDDSWADPRGEFLAAHEASPVYELFGLEGLPVREMPDLEQPVMGTVGYHIRRGGHGVTSYDWEQFLNFADLHFSDF